MKELALLAALAAMAKASAFTIVVDADPHKIVLPDCAPLVLDESAERHLVAGGYGDFICEIRAGLPFDRLTCFISSLRIIRRDSEI